MWAAAVQFGEILLVQDWDTGTAAWPGSGTSKRPILKKKNKKNPKKTQLKTIKQLTQQHECMYDLGPAARTVTRYFVQPLATAALSFVFQNLFYIVGICFSSSQTGCECFQKKQNVSNKLCWWESKAVLSKSCPRLFWVSLRCGF